MTGRSGYGCSARLGSTQLFNHGTSTVGASVVGPIPDRRVAAHLGVRPVLRQIAWTSPLPGPRGPRGIRPGLVGRTSAGEPTPPAAAGAYGAQITRQPLCPPNPNELDSTGAGSQGRAAPATMSEVDVGVGLLVARRWVG